MTQPLLLTKQPSSDGRDPAWHSIGPVTLAQFPWPQNDFRPEVQVRACYSEEAIHVQFRTYEEIPTVNYYQRNEAVHKDSCVEFFIQPYPEGDVRYLNFEFNAAGTMYLSVGKDRYDRDSLLSNDDSIFEVKAATGLKSLSDDRIYWELAFRIPFEFIIGLFPGFRAVPGAMMRGNFYKCGDETPLPHYATWHPMTSEAPDYHQSRDFGDIILG